MKLSNEVPVQESFDFMKSPSTEQVVVDLVNTILSRNHHSYHFIQNEDLLTALIEKPKFYQNEELVGKFIDFCKSCNSENIKNLVDLLTNLTKNSYFYKNQKLVEEVVDICKSYEEKREENEDTKKLFEIGEHIQKKLKREEEIRNIKQKRTQKKQKARQLKQETREKKEQERETKLAEKSRRLTRMRVETSDIRRVKGKINEYKEGVQNGAKVIEEIVQGGVDISEIRAVIENMDTTNKALNDYLKNGVENIKLTDLSDLFDYIIDNMEIFSNEELQEEIKSVMYYNLKKAKNCKILTNPDIFFKLYPKTPKERGKATRLVVFTKYYFPNLFRDAGSKEEMNYIYEKIKGKPLIDIGCGFTMYADIFANLMQASHYLGVDPQHDYMDAEVGWNGWHGKIDFGFQDQVPETFPYNAEDISFNTKSYTRDSYFSDIASFLKYAQFDCNITANSLEETEDRSFEVFEKIKKGNIAIVSDLANHNVVNYLRENPKWEKENFKPDIKSYEPEFLVFTKIAD